MSNRCMNRPVAACVAGVVWILAGAAEASQGDPVTFRIIGWNVESHDADPEFIAGQIGEQRDCDLWGLSEVANEDDAKRYRQAAGVGEDRDGDGEEDAFDLVFGTTGAGDRLAILFNTRRLEKVGHAELHHINVFGRHRAPLMAHFRGKQTDQEFLFVVNHLARGDETVRHAQAKLLNDWAEEQALPVVAAGDYNFDYEVIRGELPGRHDEGFDLMTEDGVFVWVRPEFLVSTQANDRFNTVLDFIFVSRPAFGWTATSVIQIRAGDFPDDRTKSDHRPILADFRLDRSTGDPGTAGPTDLKQQLLDRIARMEQELEAMKRLVEQMDD